MIETVKTLFLQGDGVAEIHECRHCGTNVDSPAAECPTCGGSEIATFQT